MKSHMMRVISSPSISTMGFSTLILAMGSTLVIGLRSWGLCRGFVGRAKARYADVYRKKRNEVAVSVDAIRACA
ncbi:MAG TPA: hypothetical protein DEA05_11010 [Rhodobacteraceae bacterium]|nr:hypothetical protein [Paracoccaceae bacterium]